MLGADEWQIILGKVNDYKTFKYTYLTCKIFKRLYDRPLLNIKSNFSNPLYLLIHYYPDKVQTWGIMNNKNMTEDLLYKVMEDKDVSFNDLWKNKNISSEFIEKHIDKDWNWDYMSNHPSITLDIVKKYVKFWDMYFLSQNPNITFEDMLNTNLSWDWESAAANPNITLEIMYEHPEIFDSTEHFRYFSFNPNCTWDIVEAHPYINWDWYYLPQTLPITTEIIERNFHKTYCWWIVSDSSCFTQELILKYEEFEHTSDSLRENPNITLEFVMEHLNIIGLKDFIIYNPNTNIKLILDNLDILDSPYCWENISRNPSIHWEDVVANPDLPWEWEYLSVNLSISWDTILNNPGPLDEENDWNWYAMSHRPDMSWDVIEYAITNGKELDWTYLSMTLMTTPGHRNVEGWMGDAFEFGFE